MMMMGSQEEQLLDGVAMTTSISCSAQEEPQEPRIQEDEDEELELSIQEDDEDGVEGEASPTISPLPLLAQTIKTRPRKPCPSAKPSTKKTWDTLFSLEDRLFEAHFIGLLQSTHSMMQRVSQVIVTEQYGRLKAYEQELLRVIAEVEFGLGEYERQKKSMLAQIELLRVDNDHLTRTITELHTVIEDLEMEVVDYVERNGSGLNKYIDRSEKAIPVPFARTFSHSLEEMALLNDIHENGESIIKPSQFASFLLDLKRDSQAIGQYSHSCILQSPLSQSFHENSSIRHWITEIAANLQQLRNGVCKKGPKLRGQAGAQQRTKVIEVFLKKLSRDRDYLLAGLPKSPHPPLSLWQVLHSSLVTFLGILIAETHHCPLQLSFGDATRAWTRIFLEQLKILVEESKIELKEEERRYLGGVQRLAWGVHELVTFRMQRCDGQ